ncbi:hypothetical protein [Chryseobacterium salivictor]|uniref:Uncharacterized protein n=1 Tax=Chryseobacterium salivictor TaxID=2547600 RepID=A0A4P6ZDZ4_9FLAO|nr:hypothetical protein [Chryseobacterium salivictor]QBO57717.1 hypothetical protein NBC122_00885 [Chryseobacterium salivictor]
MNKQLVVIIVLLALIAGLLIGSYLNQDKYELKYIFSQESGMRATEALLLINKQTGEIKEISNYGENYKNGQTLYKP